MSAAAPPLHPLRILIVSEMSPPYTVGGGETRYTLLARQLSAQGHAVRWLSMHQKDSPCSEVIDGVEHWHTGPRLHEPPTRPMRAKLRFMAQVAWHLFRHRYDIVDCQTYAPLPVAWLVCKLKRQPMVATIHDTAAAGPAGDQWLSGFDRRLAGLVERRLYGLAYDQVLTVSNAVKVDLVARFGLEEARVSVVPNGIDVRAIAHQPPHARPTDLIFVGRLIPHKHPDDVLRVLHALNTNRLLAGQRPYTARFIGGGPLLASLQAQAQACGQSAHCDFCGDLPMHSDVVAHIRSARVLVLPSTREGFGLVLAEAMAAGTPVVAYTLPAVAETLGAALQAQAVTAHDVDALTARVKAILTHDRDHTRLVKLGRQRAMLAFDIRRFSDRVLAVYRATIARHHQVRT